MTNLFGGKEDFIQIHKDYKLDKKEQLNID